jgi:hypothetical protein
MTDRRVKGREAPMVIGPLRVVRLVVGSARELNARLRRRSTHG